MALYEYRCTHGHVTTLIQPMSDDTPASVACETNVRTMHPGESKRCDAQADRVFAAPAAIHFKGPGFYSTDVKGRVERRRRPNVGDDLPRTHDPAAELIATRT